MKTNAKTEKEKQWFTTYRNYEHVDIYSDIDEFILKIQQLKNEGATHINFVLNNEFGETNLLLEALSHRFETEQEIENRLRIEENKRKEHREFELRQLEKLKRKYETKG